MNSNDVANGAIRTLAGFIAGIILSYLATQDINLPAEQLSILTAGLVGVLGFIYWLLAVLLQKAFPNSKIISRLLISPKTPTYKG